MSARVIIYDSNLGSINFTMSSRMNSSSEMIDIHTANRNNMQGNQHSNGSAKGSNGAAASGTNYAQQLHSDLISQALTSGPQTLPPVPDSPSLQHQNMGRKQPIKTKLASSSSRRDSIGSFNQSTNAGDKNMNSRNSSRSGMMSKPQVDNGVRNSQDFAQQKDALQQQKARQQQHYFGHQASSVATADSNNGVPRRQSSKTHQNLPPTYGGKKRSDSRQRTRMSQQQSTGFEEYSIDGHSDRRSTTGASSKSKSKPLPPRRRPTQTSSARSLQPIEGSASGHRQTPGAKGNSLNPNQVVPTPPSHLNKQSPKIPVAEAQEMMSDYEKHRQLLSHLEEEKKRMEFEMQQNESLMQEKVTNLAEERRNIQMLILKATITIQRHARGFITRMKVRKVYHLQMEFEKARLDDALAQMQAMIAAQALKAPPTPIKEEPEDLINSQFVSQKKNSGRTSQSEIANPEVNLTLNGTEQKRDQNVSLQADSRLYRQAADESNQYQRSITEQISPGVQIQPKAQDLHQVINKELLSSPPTNKMPNSNKHRYSDAKSMEEVCQKELGRQTIMTEVKPDEAEESSLIREKEKDGEAIQKQDDIFNEKEERGMLDQIEAAESDLDILDFEDEKYVKAAQVIQRQARVMIARNNFRVALYRLILLKNIVDTKIHKERMQMLYCYEQLIINTEDFDENDDEEPAQGDPESDNDCLKFIEQTGLTQEQVAEVLANEEDPYLRQQLEELYNPLVFKGLNEAEQFFENTEDIINEEDLEESICESRKQSPSKGNEKVADLAGRSYKDLLRQTQDLIAQATARELSEAQKSITADEDDKLKDDEREEPLSVSMAVKSDQNISQQQFSQKLMEKLNQDLAQKTNVNEPALTDKSKQQIKPPSASQKASHGQVRTSSQKPAWKPSAASSGIIKPLQERTISSTNASKQTTPQAQSTTNVRARSLASQGQSKTQQSGEQAKQQVTLSTAAKKSANILTQKQQKTSPAASQAVKREETKLTAGEIEKKGTTRQDNFEFSRQQPSEEQSGQINITTIGAPASIQAINQLHRNSNLSDSGSQNGSRPRQRDNSIIERNKAKLTELAEKKLQQKRQQQEQKEKEAKDTAAKPPRPFDQNRLDSLSQPRPKKEDPSLKLPPKPKKVSNQTRRQLQERAIKVKNRQSEAFDKQKGRFLAITDGQSVGSNLVAVADDSSVTTGDPNAEKRRSNILKSRELKRRASSRGSRGGGQTNQNAVFERLAQVAQKSNADKAQKKAPGGRAALGYGKMTQFTNRNDKQAQQPDKNNMLAIMPSHDFEPAKPQLAVRKSYDIVVKKSDTQTGKTAEGNPTSIRISQMGMQPGSASSQPQTSKNCTKYGVTQTNDNFYDNDIVNESQPLPIEYKPEAFTMKNLRKAQQAPAVNSDSGDDIDDIPFVSNGKRISKQKSTVRRVDSRGTSSSGQQQQQQLDTLTYSYQNKHSYRLNSELSSQQTTNYDMPSGSQQVSDYQKTVVAPPRAVVVAKPDQDKDWLLDPVNLYMRGMAQRREQMRKLQNQIGQEQRNEINRRIANFKM